MKRLKSHLVGIDRGEVVLFSDFQDGGEMWTGRGQRERRQKVAFSEPFATPPVVQVSVSLWDMDAATVIRADISAEEVTETGFDAVFRTWGDTRVARMRFAWTAIGELPDDEMWELY